MYTLYMGWRVWHHQCLYFGLQHYRQLVPRKYKKAEMRHFGKFHKKYSRTFHNSRLISGKALQGTLGFKNGSGISNMALWTLVTWSQLSQITLDKVILRISANWASVNLIRGLPFSYQNLSHFLRFLNWIPIMQANVGPTRPPWRGVSAKPPEIFKKKSFWNFEIRQSTDRFVKHCIYKWINELWCLKWSKLGCVSIEFLWFEVLLASKLVNTYKKIFLDLKINQDLKNCI